MNEALRDASEPLAELLAPKKKTAHLKLYDATEALSILDDLIAEHAALIEAKGGDIEAIPEIAELLTFAEDAFEGAVERWALKIRSLIAEAEGVNVERIRLEALEKQKMNAATRLKEYLRRQMEARQCTKIATALVTVRIQKNGGKPAVSCKSEAKIEELYASGSPFAAQRVQYVLATDAIIAAFEAGEELPEDIVVQRGTHLRVG